MVSLKWIGLRSGRPCAMAPVTARANINTLYHIFRKRDSYINKNGVYTEKNVTWTLRARREGGQDVILGEFKTLKAARDAADADCKMGRYRGNT